MKYAYLCIISLLFFELFGQEKTYQSANQYWAGYISSIRISSTYSLWNDFHYVPDAFFIGRHGVTKHLNDEISITAGYAWLFLSGVPSSNLNRMEHRPWAQFLLNLPVGKKYQIHHRVRYDARFRELIQDDMIGPDFGFNHRLRFMSSIRRPLRGLILGKKVPFITFGNEVLINFGREIRGNYLDQNRTWIMVGYEVKNATFQFGYMYRYIPQYVLNSANRMHTITLWVSQAFITRNARAKKIEELLHRDP